MSTTGVAVVGGVIAYVFYQATIVRKRELESISVAQLDQEADSDDLDGEL